MTEEFEYLDLEDLIELAVLLLGEQPPIRDVGLLGSAAARPRTSAFGTDAYSDLWTKAAALLQSIVKNHALVDGNKPLGWLAASVFLELNGVDTTSIPNQRVYELVMKVAASQLSVEDLAAQLRTISEQSSAS